MSEHTTSWIGGVELGWVMVSAPLATLIASPTCLVLKTGVLGTYRFHQEDISALECNSKALFSKSIKIIHSSLDAPVGVTFYCLEDPQKIVEGIRELGFIPEAHALRVRRGLPVRWTAILIAIAVWSLPFLVAQWYPSMVYLQTVALIVLLLSSHLLLADSSMQKLVLKQGRRVGEIRPFLRLCILILWMFALIAGTVLIISKYPTLIVPLLLIGQLAILFVVGYFVLKLLRSKK